MKETKKLRNATKNSKIKLKGKVKGILGGNSDNILILLVRPQAFVKYYQN